MIAHLQLLDELEQQTAALEVAVSHQQWEEAALIMERRLLILQTLTDHPVTDETLRSQIRQLATTILAREQQLTLVLRSKQQTVEQLLLNLKVAGKARQLYRQHCKGGE
ncbi:hypothetical protein SJS40_15835 [Aeromonas caviae]|uniref:hypothetical protein n=1 Tax=Aeromonas TaxID=642 RepID=UPI000CDD1DB4|nr:MULTISPECIES: hypothetical protein [Aeromonas]MDH0475834.1 hypothetical protein [Aeromonas caviae]MDX7755003.1 hypothetical protein [Aeromonas caviae]MDX7776414.1 hypothetical protein [Aeromonas caviae]POV85506.1 hypothetical protein C3418_20890 [Aeromonas sp. ASNIH8]QLL88110.1 hypothetical protein GWG10_07565 [Aeromonas caviae]